MTPQPSILRPTAPRTGAALLSLLLGLPFAPAAVAWAPPEVPNVRVNAPQAGQYGRMGNTLAASADGTLLVAAWDDMQGTCGPPFDRPCPPQEPPGLTGVGVSTDGGRTWTDLGAPPPTEDALTGGHAWIDRGGLDDRTFYLVTRARRTDSANAFLGQVGILLHRGQFEDGSFVWQDARYFGPARKGDYWRGPNVAAAKDGSGKIYIAVTNLREVCGRPSSSGGSIELLRSEDGGDTWSEPVVVARDTTLETTDPKDPVCGTHGYFQFTPQVHLGPSGEVYVLWQLGPEFDIDWAALTQVSPPFLGFGFSRSLDGGRTFSHPRYVKFVNSLAENAPAGFSKDAMNDTPRMAVARAGPHRGRLYLTYAESVEETTCRNDIFSPKDYSPLSSQAFLLWSDNRGQTWNGPIPLGPPVPRTGVKRFFPTPSVRPDGTLDIAYFESRETQLTPDPHDVECPLPLGSGLFRQGHARSLVDLWWVRSADGGASFGPPVRVTSKTSDWCAAQYDFAGFLFPNFGDYLGIFPAPDGTFLLWTDGRDAVPEAYFTKLGGAAE